MDLHSENIILTAKQFNPSIVTQLWLVKQEIAKESEFAGQQIFTPALVAFQTTQFEIVLGEDRLQFTPRCAVSQQQQVVEERLGRFVTTLPHTPYTACGINFAWCYVPGVGIEKYTRERFLPSQKSALANEFGGSDARFGSLFTKQHGMFVLTLRALPATVGPMLESSQLLLDFNFHIGFADNSENVASTIRSALREWSNLRTYSQKLSQLFIES